MQQRTGQTELKYRVIVEASNTLKQGSIEDTDKQNWAKLQPGQWNPPLSDLDKWGAKTLQSSKLRFIFQIEVFFLLFAVRTSTVHVVSTREYWIIQGGRSFLAIEWFGSSTTPLPAPRQQDASLFLSLPVCHILTGKGGGGKGGGSQIIRPTRESLVLYKSFYTIWSKPSFPLFLLTCTTK